MKFVHRFAYYMIGFVVGIFFLFFVLNGKETRCSYMPNARVLNDLSTKSFHYSDSASVVLAQTWIDTLDIKNSLKYGDVDFSRSNVQQPTGGKLYVVEGRTMDNIKIDLYLTNFTDKVVLNKIEKK